MFRDFFARVRDVVGGRVGGYEAALQGAKQAAIDDMVEQARELGANAVIAIDLDYETVGNTMLMVSANGRSEEHTSELQSLMRISYAVLCLKKKKKYILKH